MTESRGPPPEPRRPGRGDATAGPHEIVGRAGPVALEALEVPAEAAEELVVLKAGDVFLCTRPDGDIHPGPVSGEGLFMSDTRYLCGLRMQIAGRRPVPLSYSTAAGSRAVLDATNPQLSALDGDSIHQQALNIRRILIVDERLYCELTIRSYWPRPVRTSMSLSLAADFADVFELRGFPRRDARGHTLAPRDLDHGASLGYVGEDEVVRHTVIEWDREPLELDIGADRISANWQVAIEPGADFRLLVTIEPSVDGRRRSERTVDGARRSLQASEEEWGRSCTTIVTSNALMNRWLDTSSADLHSLMTPMADEELPAAGVPWYVAPFGRDSLITSYQALLLNPVLARHAPGPRGAAGARGRPMARRRARQDPP